MVIDKGFGEYQPVCGTCGIALCYSLSEYEYEEHKQFWDDWECHDCSPDYFGQWAKARRLQHYEEING